METITLDKVKEILKTIKDPELGINIVDLGLVYKITIGDEGEEIKVRVVMTLTTPGCPLGGWFVEQIKQALALGLKIEEAEIMVEITFDPPWSQECMSDEIKAELGLD